MATETKTFYPGAHEGFSGNEIRNATNPVGKGSSNTTYADVNAASKGTAYCYWPFDVSAIPENATIDSVSCVVGVMVSSGAAPFSGNIQLYSGSTAKGTASSLSYSTSKKIITLSVGTWTRAELNGIRLRTYLKNNGSFAFSLSFYGADLTVQYTYQGQKFMLKLGGAWHDVARVFKKVSGIWVEQTDLANVIEDGVRYKNGGEIVPPNPVVSIIGTGDATLAYVTINGKKYTSASEVEVERGTVITVHLDSSAYYNPGHRIYLNGTQVTSGAGDYSYTVTDNCTLTFTSKTYSGTVNAFWYVDIVTTG